jgi:DnaJ-class molecular chaperone
MWVIIGAIGVLITGLIALFMIKVRCPICSGSGWTYEVSVEECSNCRGTGSVSVLNWVIIRIFKRKSSLVR